MGIGRLCWCLLVGCGLVAVLGAEATAQVRLTLPSKHPADNNTCYVGLLSPDGRTVAGGYWRLNLWDAAGKYKVTLPYDLNGSLGRKAAAISPDGKVLALALYGGEIKLAEVANGVAKATFEVPGHPYPLFSPD